LIGKRKKSAVEMVRKKWGDRQIHICTPARSVVDGGLVFMPSDYDYWLKSHHGHGWWCSNLIRKIKISCGNGMKKERMAKSHMCSQSLLLLSVADRVLVFVPPECDCWPRTHHGHGWSCSNLIRKKLKSAV